MLCGEGKKKDCGNSFRKECALSGIFVGLKERNTGQFIKGTGKENGEISRGAEPF